MEFEKVLLSRKSCRSYKADKVEKEKLEKVITAASLAPVGLPKDGRPHLTVVTDEDVLRSLGGAFGPDKDIIYGAPALIVVSCPQSRPGIAEMNAATDLGLGNIYLYGVCMALQNNRELAAKLGIPENHKPLSALAVGYGSEDVAPCKEFKEVLTRNDI